ncbi:MAG: protein-S-isoprenylcysteine methyltransferase [Burkholderiales bacterium RIFCSPLOWO2_12_FULL_64_99]|nr:MAG: protein-S-isoprenylcysteine methyltransferase [Burkholderiales bacterium RIFCSPLOWO2_12_FULL_64_99]
MHSLELRVPPLALVVIFACLMALSTYFVPVGLPIPTPELIACVLAVAGAGIAFAGVLAFRRHKTTVNPFTPERSSSLVASGIYRYTRNPMYLGFLLALVGWAVFLSNLVALALLPAFIAYMNRFQIQPEERALRAHFGTEFQAYMHRVRRWI